MLEIYINGFKADLPPDISLSITIENPFLIPDRIPVAHSIDFELPPTANNHQIFDYAYRIPTIQSGKGFFKTFECQIIFDAVTISTGYLELTDFTDNYKCFFKAAEITDNLRESLPATELAKLTFPTSNMFNVDFDNPANYAYAYRQMAINAATGSNPMMVTAPIRVNPEDELNFIHGTFSMSMFDEVVDTVIPKHTGAMMQLEYINFYNPKSNEFMLRGPFTPLIGYDAVHAEVFPLVRLHYLLTTLFGGRLDNNFFSAGELANLVIPSTYFRNWFAPDTWIYISPTQGMMFENTFPTSENPYFYLNSFQSGVLAAEFIRQILKLFCSSLISVGGRFVLKKNKDIIADSAAIDWSDKMIGKPSISSEKGQVYKYGYGESAPKSYPSFKTMASVNAMILDDIAPIGEGSNEVIYQITSTNQTFRKITEKILPPEETDPPIIKNRYEILDSGLGFQDIENGSTSTFDVSSDLKPLATGPAEYWWTALNTAEDHPATAWWCVPQWSGERAERPEQSTIMFYRGSVTAPTAGDSYPFLTPFNVAPNGAKIGDYSLAWTGDDGLINKFHNEFKEWVEKDKVKFSSAVLLKPLDLHNLDITKKVLSEGRKFYLRQLQMTLKANKIEPAICEFIEA